jgi:hypothetical protein
VVARRADAVQQRRTARSINDQEALDVGAEPRPDSQSATSVFIDALARG